MNFDRYNWRPRHDYGPATWTDLMHIRECRLQIAASKQRLKLLARNRAKPTDIIQERTALEASRSQLHQLESKFELNPSYF